MYVFVYVGQFACLCRAALLLSLDVIFYNLMVSYYFQLFSVDFIVLSASVCLSICLSLFIFLTVSNSIGLSFIRSCSVPSLIYPSFMLYSVGYPEADPRAQIRPWPPSNMAMEFWPPLGEERIMIVL